MTSTWKTKFHLVFPGGLTINWMLLSDWSFWVIPLQQRVKTHYCGSNHFIKAQTDANRATGLLCYYVSSTCPRPPHDWSSFCPPSAFHGSAVTFKVGQHLPSLTCILSSRVRPQPTWNGTRGSVVSHTSHSQTTTVDNTNSVLLETPLDCRQTQKHTVRLWQLRNNRTVAKNTRYGVSCHSCFTHSLPSSPPGKLLLENANVFGWKKWTWNCNCFLFFSFS